MDETTPTRAVSEPRPRSFRQRLVANHAPEYNAAFVFSLKLQALLCILAALTLDGGRMHRAFWVAVLCQWGTVWVLLFLRSTEPTELERLSIRYGVIPWLIFVFQLLPFSM